MVTVTSADEEQWIKGLLPVDVNLDIPAGTQYDSFYYGG